MTDIASLTIRVNALEAQAAQRELEELARRAANAERGVTSLGSASNVAKSALRELSQIAATALAGFTVANAINEIGSFESKMISVKALTDATGAQFEELTKQARELGATTAFSAQQAAEAQGVLAAAGLKTNEILSATPGVLQLAAAGTLSLSQAADIATGTLSGMGLGVESLAHVNDVLAKAAADTKSSVESLGGGLAQSAPIAKAFKIDVETLTAALGTLANNNIKGSEAGNNFKAMLTALGNETKEKTELLRQHGLAYKDLDIQARGLVPVLETLKNAHLTGAEAIKLFGSDAAAASLILANGSKDVDTMTESLRNSEGAANKMAAQLNTGLSKAIDAFKGTVSEAVLQLGDAGLKKALTDIITEATGVIAVYEGLLPKFAESNGLTKEQTASLQNLAKEYAADAQAALGFAGGILAVVSALKAYDIAIAASAAVSRINPFTGLIVSLGALIGLIYSAKSGLLELTDAQSKLGDIDKQIAHQEKKISIMRNQGFVGNAIDTIAGNSIGGAEDEITKLQVRRSAIVKQLDAESSANKSAATATTIKAAADSGAAVAAAALGDTHEAASKKTAKLTEAQKEAKKAAEDQARLLESLRSPTEIFIDSVNKLSGLYNTGAIDIAKFDLWLGKYSDDLKSASDSGFVAVTAQEKLNEAYAKASDLFAAGKTSQAGYAEQLNTATNQFKPETKGNFDGLNAYNDLIKTINSSTKDLGATNSAVFDGALGGVNALVGAFDNMTKSIAQATAQQEALNQQRASATNELAGLGDREKFTAMLKVEGDYLKANKILEDQKTSAELTGLRQVIGATANMFDQKSHAAKGLHTLEQTIGAAQLAMNAAKIASDIATTGPAVASGVAQLFAQGGWAGFAGAAALLALMAGLGFSGGGGSGGIPAIEKSNPDTGTVLGDKTAQSQSVGNVYTLLQDIHASEYRELRGINEGVANLHDSIINAVTGIFQRENLSLPSLSPNSSDFFGSTTNEISQNRIIGGPINIGDLFSGKKLDLTHFIETKTTDEGLFWTSVDVSEIRNKLSRETTAEIENIFKAGGKSLIEAGKVFNLDVESAVKALTLPALNIDLKGLTGEEATKKLSAVVSTAIDGAATAVFPQLAKYQKIGEGLFETLGRVATEVGVVENSFKMVGAQFKVTGFDAVALADSLVNASGTLKDLRANFEDFFSKFFSEGERFGYTGTALADQLKDFNLVVPATREGWRSLVQETLSAGESSAKTSAQLLSLTNSADQYYNYLEKATNIFLSLGEKLKGKTWSADFALTVSKGLTDNAIDAFNKAAGTKFDRSTISDIYNDPAKITQLDSFTKNNPVLGGLAVDAWTAYNNEVSANLALTQAQTNSQTNSNVATKAAVDTTQLEIRLAEALGDKQKALNLRREAELKTLDLTSQALLKQIYQAEDRTTALEAETARQNQAAKDAQDAADKRNKLLEEEAKAAKIAADAHKTLTDTLDSTQLSYIKSTSSDFYNQMLDLGIGFIDTIKKVVENGGSLQDAATVINTALTTGANAYKKANTALTATFNDVLKTINAKGYTISDQIATLTDKNSVAEIQRLRAVGQLSSTNYQEQLSAVDTLYNLTMDRYNAEQTKVTALKDAAKSIGDYIDKFKLGSLSTLSPEARLAEARAQYAATLATAKAGDTKALGDVTGKFDTYAQAAKDYYASSEPYQKIIADGINELSGLTGAGNDPARQTAANTAQTVEYLKTLQGVLTDITKQQTSQYTIATQTLANEFKNIAAQFTAAVYELGASKGVSAGSINQAVQNKNPFGIVNGAFSSPAPTYGMDALSNGNWDLGTAEIYARRSGLFSESDIRGFLNLSQADQAQVIADLKKQGKTFASGGLYGGGLALVGERGPELINFRNPGQVYTADQTRATLQGDNKETVAELREQNRLLRLAIELLQDGFNRTVNENSKQSEALDAMQRRTRIAESV